VVPAENTLVVPQVRWRLLKTVVIREGSLDLVHVQASVKMVQAILLQVFVEKGVAIHMRINAIISNDIWI